jgi:ankyrin repeat protein
VQEGKTDLMLAAENGRHDAVKFLLDNGSDADQATKVRSVPTEASELSA